MALDHQPHIAHAKFKLELADAAEHRIVVELMTGPADPASMRRGAQTLRDAKEALRILLYEPTDGWQP